MCLCYSSCTLFREEKSLWRHSSLTRFDSSSSLRTSWPMSLGHMQGYNSFPLVLHLPSLSFLYFLPLFPSSLLRLFVSFFRASSLSVRHSSAPPLPPSPPSPPHSISTSSQPLTSIADRSVCPSVCLSVRLSIPLLMVYCFLWLGGDWCSHHSRGQWDALRD